MLHVTVNIHLRLLTCILLSRSIDNSVDTFLYSQFRVSRKTNKREWVMPFQRQGLDAHRSLNTRVIVCTLLISHILQETETADFHVSYMRNAHFHIFYRRRTSVMHHFIRTVQTTTDFVQYRLLTTDPKYTSAARSAGAGRTVAHRTLKRKEATAYARSWLSRAAVVTASATPPGVVDMLGLFRISADTTLSASSLVAPLSAGSLLLASCRAKHRRR